MHFFKKAAKLSKRDLKDVIVLCLAAVALVGAAVLLSGDIPSVLRPLLGVLAPHSSVATPYGVVQGIPEYDAPSPYKGGYPGPLSCNYGGAQCYPNARIAQLSIYPVGSLQGQTVMIDQYGATSTVGSTPTLFAPGPVRIEWACLPSQYAQRTCSYIYECGNWWRSAQCAAYYDCSTNSTYANTSTGANFSTGGALIGTTTVTFPTGPTSYTYTLQCKNSSDGRVWSASIPVMITSATLSLTADPTEVVSGGTSQLTWATTLVTQNSCTIVDPKGAVGAKGLGSDTSGSGNSWVLNNLSTVDQVAQSPTQDYANLSADYYYSGYSKGAIQAGGLAANGNYGTTASWQLTSGKWYWEFTLGGLNGCYPIVGIWADATSGFATRAYPGHGDDNGIGYSYCPYFTRASQNLPITPPTSVAGDVIGIAYDADTGKVFFSKNGTWMNTGNPVAGTGAIGVVKNGWPGFASYYGKTYANFGQGGAPSVVFSDASSYNRGLTVVTGLNPKVSTTRAKFGASSGFFSSSALVTPE